MTIVIIIMLLFTSESVYAADEISTMRSMNAVAVWPFNEASGTTINDVSGNGQNGTYQSSGVTLGAAAIVSDGSTNTAVTLNTSTTTAYLGSVPNSSTIGLANFTFVGWLQFNSTNSTAFAIPFSMDLENGTSGWEAVRHNGATDVYARIDTPGNGNQTNLTSYLLFNGNIQMLAMGILNNAGFLSVDAGTYTTFSIAGTFGNPSSALFFGNSTNNVSEALNCNGTYQDAALFSGQLTQQQLTTLYNCGSGAGGCVAFTPPVAAVPTGPGPISINPPPLRAQRLRGARL